MTKLNSGNIPLDLGGRRYELKATLEAAEKIDDLFGGVIPAIDEVRKMKTTAIVQLVVIGVGTKSKGGIEKLRQMIYDEGLATVAPAVVRFLVKILNPNADDEDDLDPADVAEGDQAGEG